MILKEGHSLSYKLKLRDVEQCLFTCEQLLHGQIRKGLLHCIVTGDEKWICYNNTNCSKS